VISIDAKKKELLGEYKNGGSDYGPQGQPIEVNTHDFEDKKTGQGRPLRDSTTSAPTSAMFSLGIDPRYRQFAVNAVRLWLEQIGRKLYPGMKRLHDHRRRRGLQWFTPAALEVGAPTTRRRKPA